MVGSIDGDFYLDTTNVGFYYGPRAAGVWGTPHPFGNSLNGVPLVNVTATTSPTVANDNTQGYSRGSYWINTTNNAFYTCTNSATGAAVWQQTIQVGNAAGGDLTGVLPNPTVSKITGVPVSGTPVFGQGIFATSGAASQWEFNPYLFGDTGVAYGGTMTFNAGHPTQFNIAAGVGYIVDNVTTPASPTVTQVTIAAQTIDITTFVASPAPSTRTTNWWLMNAAGTVIVQGTSPTNVQRRTLLILGVTASTVGPGVLFNVQTLPVVQAQPGNQVYDLMYALGPFNVTGNAVTANGANLSFNKSVGTTFDASFNAATTMNNPHITVNPAETPATFRNSTQISGSQGALVTTLDVTHYDVGGTITAVPNPVATATIQRIWLFGTGIATAQLALQYGQATYSTLAAAVAAVGTEPFIANPDYSGIAVLLGWIAVSKSCLSLQDTTTSAIIFAPKFAVP